MASDMQGFRKEEVRIRADSNGHVTVSGERQANDNTILHFEQAYKVPEGCNIEETNAILEDETYYVIIAKKLNSSQNQNSISTSIQTDHQAQESTSDGVDNTNNDDSNQNHEEKSDTNLLKKLSKMMKKKKRCLALTALLAFSLGVLASYRYQLTTQKDTKKGAADDV